MKRFYIRMNEIIVVLLLIHIQNTQAGPPQRRLLQYLFRNYNPLERPVENDGDSLQVDVGLSIQQIVDIVNKDRLNPFKSNNYLLITKDEKKQTIIYSGWLDISWNDYNLVWNPEEFENITKIRVPSSRIWIPDLLLYNSADNTFDSTSKVNAVVESDGNVSYIPPGMFKSTCVIKVEDFPFDKQICTLKFGSWTYDDIAINLRNKSDHGQNGSYIKNSEWYLENILSYSESVSYDCCPEKYPFVMFEIHIRRRTLYFEFNLIFPCILISFMSLLGFSLPPDSGEKIGLEVTVLLVIIMFSQVISDLIPASSLSVPRIAIYFMSVMVICSMSIVANIFVLILHHRNVRIQKPMPRWVRILICGYLAKMLRIKIPHKLKEYSRKDSLNSDGESITKDKGSTFRKTNGPIESNSLGLLKRPKSKSIIESTVLTCDTGHSNKINHYLASNKSLKLKTKAYNDQQYNANCPNNVTYIIRENSNFSQLSYESTNDLTHIKSDVNILKTSLNLILRELYIITNKIRENIDYEEKELGWKFAAMVIDRLCMILFTILTIVSTAIILLGSKNFFRDSDPDERF